jgi:hypothetical protein
MQSQCQQTDLAGQSLYVIEASMSYFFMQAELGKHSGARKPEEIRQDYRDAAQLAALAASFRHSRLTRSRLRAIRTALYGSGTTPPPTSCAPRLWSGATLQDASLIDLQALPAPDGETVRQVRRGGTI